MLRAFFLQERLRSSQCTGKRYLRIRDYIFIEGPTAEPASQIISTYSITTRDCFCDGLNRPSMDNDQLIDLETALLTHELERANVALFQPTAEHGRGLLTARHFGNGDEIEKIAFFWFDDSDRLQAFLRAKPYYRDRTIALKGIVNETGQPKNVVRACMCGVGQYVQHYLGIGRRPNAVLHLDTAEGFNYGALTLRADTRNNCGIAPRRMLLVSYGNNFNFEKADESEGKKKFAGALDFYFNKLTYVRTPRSPEAESPPAVHHGRHSTRITLRTS